MKRIKTIRVVLFVLTLMGMIGFYPSGNVLGFYEEGQVTSAGTLEGRIILEGTVPPSRIFHLVSSPNFDFCQKISDGKGNRLLREFNVSESGGFQNVVVAVIGVQGGKPFNFTPTLEIENCRIAPFVTPVRNNKPLILRSHDPITHDIQAYSIKNPEESYTFQMFNKPMPAKTNTSKKIKFRKGHYIFKTQCGVHSFMQSWGIAVGNPYFAVTGPEGEFSIPDLPAGTYDVIAWHPHMSVQAKRVTVSPDDSVSLEFTFDASEMEIPEHDLQMGYKWETRLSLRELLAPSVELQTP